MALRGPRAYLGKVKKSQGVILRLSALKFKIKIRRAIWPPPQPDSFCNELSIPQHSFRLPEMYYTETKIYPLFQRLTPLVGPLKIIFKQKQHQILGDIKCQLDLHTLRRQIPKFSSVSDLTVILQSSYCHVTVISQQSSYGNHRII